MSLLSYITMLLVFISAAGQTEPVKLVNGRPTNLNN